MPTPRTRPSTTAAICPLTQGPYAKLMSALVHHLASDIPAITFKTGFAFHCSIADSDESEGSLIRMVDALNSGSPVLFLDVRQRPFTYDAKDRKV